MKALLADQEVRRALALEGGWLSEEPAADDERELELAEANASNPSASSHRYQGEAADERPTYERPMEAGIEDVLRRGGFRGPVLSSSVKALDWWSITTIAELADSFTDGTSVDDLNQHIRARGIRISENLAKDICDTLVTACRSAGEERKKQSNALKADRVNAALGGAGLAHDAASTSVLRPSSEPASSAFRVNPHQQVRRRDFGQALTTPGATQHTNIGGSGGGGWPPPLQAANRAGVLQLASASASVLCCASPPPPSPPVAALALATADR